MASRTGILAAIAALAIVGAACDKTSPTAGGGGGATSTRPTAMPSPPPSTRAPRTVPSPARAAGSLAGTWVDHLGQRIAITHVGNRVRGEVIDGDACYATDRLLFDGAIDGATLYGTMRFCPQDFEAVPICGYPSNVDTNFVATIGDGFVEGTYDGWAYRTYPCDQGEPVPTYFEIERE